MERTFLPLHPAQRDVYTDQLINAGSAHYNIGGYIRLKGSLDKGKFEETIHSIPQVFDAFRMRFKLEQNGPVFYVAEDFDKAELDELDFSNQEDSRQVALDWMQGRFNTAFVLEEDSLLFENCLIKISPDEHWYFGRFHHLITDGYGFIVFVQYVAQKYKSLVEGVEAQFSYPFYKEEAEKAAAYFSSDNYATDAAYWKEKVAGKPARLLPGKYALQNTEGHTSSTYTLDIDPQQKALLDELQISTKAGLQHLTIAALIIYFGKITDQPEFIFGVPVHKRSSKRLRNIVGMFSGILPFKGTFNKEETVTELVKAITRDQRIDYRHQDFPIGDLTREIKIKEDGGYLHEISVNYEPLNFSMDFGKALQASITRIANDHEPYPLQLCWREYGNGQPLQLQVHYGLEYFTREDIELFVQRLLFVIDQFPQQLENAIESIDTLPAKERFILDQYNSNDTPPRDWTITKLFEEQVAKTPSAIALVFEEEQLTYHQLNERSNQLAHYLKQKGVKQEALVPICLERSTEMIIGILGILKAGAAYVPLDSGYPMERIGFMLEDTDAEIVISSKATRSKLPASKDFEVIEIDTDWSMISEQPVTNLQTPVAPDHLAYVIYTSGSMGKPKGVMIEHRGVTSLVKDVDYVFLNASDILLSTGSFSFDATTFEYWGMLLNGGQLVLCTENRLLESALLKEEINNKQVNIMWLTSSWFNQLVETDITVFERLKTILVGGEKLSEQHIKKLRQVYPSIEIINGYGPTENTTFSLTYKIKDAVLERSIPIGRPLNNRTAYILNDKLEVVPLGVAGEICVGGAGLARGYLNRPELTAQKFVANPFNDEEGSRLYRTGDLGRFQPGGNIEYLGRIDDQVKIRGYRIELGEIESVLLQSGMVRQAVVLAKEDTRLHKRLVGYIVPNEGFDRKAVATYLRAQLPEYMAPAIWVEVESMPLTANGKTDRKALPDPDITEQVTVSYVAPQNETQAGLAAIWKDLLNLEKVGIEDNFFELGGDSIIAIQLISRVRRLGYSLQPKDIFIQQTIANIAQVIIGRAEAVSFAEQGYLKGTAGLLPIQQWYFEKEPSAVSHFNQSVLLKISKQITAHILQQAIDQLVAHHDALRFVYTKKNGLWQQEYGSGKPEIVIEDLRSIPVHLLDTYINEQAEVHQRSLNIEAGDIFRTAWMQTPVEEEHNFLFIVIHHLAVDGVSWRILVEDLQQLLDQLLNGRTPDLGNKTTSYREWYKTLEKYGKRKSLLSQKTYWEQAIENYEPLLDNDTDDVVKVKDLDNYLVELDADQTRNLLQQVPHVYHTEINDILLTVLTQTICKWIGRDSVVIGIEGHGREYIEDTADISRTIGWFTSLYPVSLSIAGASEATDLVKTIKEQLRQVPGKGLSYGVLKYIKEEISLQGKDPWDIVFNYLGQLDNVTSEGKLLKVAGLAAGASVSEEQVAEKLVLDCHVQDGRMVIKWSFSKKHFAEKTIQKLADDYAANLGSLIEHCLRQDKRANTHIPSDYGLGGVVNYKELDRFLDESFNGVKRHESIDCLYPLSGLQQGMLFHGLYDGEAGAYINQLTCNLAGVNIELVIKSWNEILKRHTILRSAFYHDAFSVPVQCVYKEVDMPVTILDYCGMNEQDRSLAIKEYQEDDRRRGFDFKLAPLMRLALIRSAEDHWLMIWTSHHILFDGWSLPVLIENFLSTYDSLLAGKETNDTAVDRFEDYIRFIENSDKELQETYWRNYLKEVEQGSLLPFIETTTVRTKGTGIYNSTLFNLDAASTETLHQYAQVHHLTINTVMQGVWATLLHRYTNNENIVYGVIESGRPDQLDKVEQRVGMYINTIPFHTTIKSEKPIVEWLQEIQSQQAESRQYQHTSLTSIQKWIGLQGDLFDSLLVFENYPISKVLKENKWSLQLDNIQLHEQTNYPLTIVITNTEQLSIQFTYNADLLPAMYVKLMQDHFKQALLQFISNENRLNDVKIITEAEKQQLVYGFNDTTATYPTNKNIVDLVEEQVEKYPSNIAVVYENEELTYKQLNERANQLAHDLQTRGVIADTLVPICLERNIEMIIGILAILKAGGAYVPIDPDYPAERIQYMLQDTAAKVILASSETVAGIKVISNVDVILVDDKDAFSDQPAANLHINILPEQLAYVIYTSGSTGRPKGVLIEHRNVVRLFKTEPSLYDFNEHDAWSVFHSFSFDFSVWEMYGALFYGGKMVIVPQDITKDAAQFADLIIKEKITVLNQTPSAFYILQEAFANIAVEMPVRYVIFGGEALNPALLQPWLKRYPGSRLVNMYGITETTVHVSFEEIKWQHTLGGKSIIGKPIPTLAAYIADSNLDLVPIGVAGELLISGAGLARGYLNRPELTAEKFIKNHFTKQEGARIYRTGDLGRWLPDGTIEYLGRIDEQVKIRGYRIELGEIETVLQQSGLVRQSVVLAREDNSGNKRLVGYVVATTNEFDRPAVISYLKSRLPEYMVPAVWVVLDTMPLSANGKIAKKSLPDPDLNAVAANEYEAPRNDREQALANIWQQLLGIEKVGINDNFFDLGGDSLLAMRAVSAIRRMLNVEIAIKDFFEHPALANLSAFLQEQEQTLLPAIQSNTRPELTPLSFSQERLWFIDQLEGSLQYHVQAVLNLEGNLDKKILAASLQTILNRHEVLRTVIREKNGKGYQYIMDADSWQLDIVDGSKYKANTKALQSFIQQLIKKRFDLSRDHMLRASLIILDEGQSVLVVTMHHIASDAWSMSIIVKEVAELYSAYSEGRSLQLPKLDLQYADYAIWQRNYLQGDVLEQKVQYWKNKLEGVAPLQLPTDFKRPAVRGTDGASINFSIEKNLLGELNELGQKHGSTLFMTLLAAFKVLLYRYSGQQDISVGTSIGNRSQQEIEGLVGFFVNTLALRTEVDSNEVFAGLLQKVKTTTLEAYGNQEVPFEKVVETTVKDRGPGRSPLFQVMLVLLNTPEISQLRLGDVALTLQATESNVSKFDITLFVSETAKGLDIIVEYSTDLYKKETITRMMEHFNNLLSSVVKAPGQKIGLLPMLTTVERQELLEGFNEFSVVYPKEKTIVSLFEEQAEKAPNNAAVVFEKDQLSYRELNERSNQLAHYLLSKEVKKDTLVPIFIDRSTEMLVAIMGILKAGAAYVPIDVDFPQDRISYMLEDTAAKIVVSSKKRSSVIHQLMGSSVDVLELDENNSELNSQPTTNLQSSPAPNDLAYVIYTSGSTGKPKGVMIEHRSLADYVFGLNDKTQIGQCSSFALVSTIATDLGNTVIFSSLVFGGALHLFAKETVSNAEALYQYFRAHQIDCLKIVPSHWKALSEDEKLLLPRKLLVFGGEALQAEMVEDIRLSGSACVVVNHYGPTETTIGKLLHVVNESKKYSGTIPIGKPFSNTSVYILSKELQPCPTGVLGQLYISGDGIARGYLNNADLTKEKFIANPFSKKGSVMYATGDLVKYLPGGDILFAGRVDDQVKIRGYRVELGEIESILQQSELVSQAVVLAREDKQGNKRLVAYIVANGWFDREEILTYLKEKLPEYMVPALLVEIESLPLTANGKVDRKALPDPDSSELLSDQYTAPRNEAEEILAAIWQDILEVEQVGIHDDFFALGGHSLLAIRLISAIRKELQVELPISDIFDYPTIATLSSRLNKQEGATTLPHIKEGQPRPKHIPLSFSQERLWFIDQMDGSIQYHVPAVLKLKGKLDVSALGEALQQIVQRHEILRTVIRAREGQAFQVITEKPGQVMTLPDSSRFREDPAALEQYLKELMVTPFNLSEDLMIRAHLIALADDEYLLEITLHHIASDGWSRSILVKELVELYAAIRANKAAELPALPIQYADYAVWQRDYFNGEVLESKLGYWKSQLEGVLPLQLPTDFTRPPIQGTRGAIFNFSIDKDLTHKVQQLGHQYGATLYMTLLSVFKVLLYRYSGQEDICVGTGISGRQQQELEGLIGFFVNTLAMRTRVNSNESFTSLLQQVKKTTLEAYAHQEVPFEKVVEAVEKERDLSRNPLFQVTFIVQNTPDVPELLLGDVQLSIDDHLHATSKFDITFSIKEVDNGLEGIIEYSTDLYLETTIERMAAHFQQLLISVIKSPGEKIDRLQLLTSFEEQALRADFNAKISAWPPNQNLVDLFEEQASKTPGAIALEFEHQQISYSILNERSNQLARHLQSRGVTAEVLVPVCIERGPEMIIAILGILKAGGAYVPIDPDYPGERISFILRDTSAALIISSKQSSSKIPDNGIEVIRLDEDQIAINQQPGSNLPHRIASNQLAYIIYTSGSTGKPKGVMIEHGSVVNLIYAQTDYFGIRNDERILQFSNYSFDASVEQIFLALLNGASLILFPEGLHYNTILFKNFLEEKAITHLHATPFFLENIPGGKYENLRRVIAGGDICRKELAEKWKDKLFYNEYGPTETTVTSIEYCNKSIGDINSSVPIGQPLANVSLYILDKNRLLCPAGIPGEMYIGGVQVARGYLNLPELTAEKFIPDPFSNEDGARLYKTGDMGRWLPNGNLEFLGRIDDQVKLRGYRIELGEIENVLNDLPMIENSCVVVKNVEGGTNRLVGYYVPVPEVLREKEHELYIEQVNSWKEIHENEYVLAEEAGVADEEFNILGWNDSFTRKPIAEEYMREWLKDIIDVILVEEPKHVLEIGSGTGLLYYQLAGKVEKYIGTDFSKNSINKISERINKALREYGPTELKVCAAHEISLDQNEQVDTIILNSVVQYFPGGDYLTTVIEKSISLLKGNGRIIIGDVRDRRMLSLFKSRLLLDKLHESLSIPEFKWAVEQEVLKEEELCFSPEYFYNLLHNNSQVTHVEIQWKKASYINELSSYRFTVVIHVGIKKELFDPKWQTWSNIDKPVIIESIKQKKDATIAIKDVPNSRLWLEKQLSAALSNNPFGNTQSLLNAIAEEDPESMEVAAFLRIAEDSGYQYRLFLDEDPLRVNILLELQPTSNFIRSVYSSQDHYNSNLFTNVPLFTDINVSLQKEMRLLLQQYLPDYMMPSGLIALGQLPLNSNGKVDRKLLSHIENKVIGNTQRYQAPRNTTEQTLSNIWQHLLNIEQVSVNDNFFELGGHSLLAMRVIASIRKKMNVELSIKDLFIHPTVESLAVLLQSQNNTAVLPPIGTGPRPEHIPLSFSQERLWFIDQLEGSVQYHIPALLRLSGKLDITALEHALRAIVNRHEVLRTVIREHQGIGYQQVMDKDGWRLVVEDGAFYRNNSKELEPYIGQLVRVPFDLAKDHMLRGNLICLDEEEYLLLITMHHIASDGWSMPVLVKEVVELYQSYVQKRAAQLPTLNIQYADYAIWQRKYLYGELLDTKLSYWKEKLQGVAPLELPTDYIRPAVQAVKGAVLSFSIDRDLSEQLLSLSKQRSATLFMTLITSFKILLHRYSGQQDISVGTPIANRAQQEVENLIGFFINTLVLRSEVSSDVSFSDLLQQVRETTLEAYAHQDVPFEKVVDAVVVGRDMSRSPLFQVMFVLQNTPEVPELRLGDVQLTPEDFSKNTSKFDLTLTVTETAHGLGCAVQYCTDLYKQETITRLITHFKELLKAVVNAPQQKIGLLPMLTANEEQRLLVEFNDTHVEYPADKTIVDLFEERVIATPEAIAVQFEEEALSFKELNTRANQLARYLVDKGVTTETLVPICIERSLEMMIGLLAIMKAGGAYVPIDPSYPKERIRFMMEDTNAAILVTTKSSQDNIEKTGDFEIVEVDNLFVTGNLPGNNLQVNIDPANLVYVIYTSGSTGMPKGVMIEHRALLDHCFGVIKSADLKTCESFALFAPLVFDAGHSIIHSSFILGASLNVISDNLLMDGEKLTDYLHKHPVDCIKIVPSLWMSYAEENNLVLSKKAMIFGGEGFNVSILQHLTKANYTGNVFNHYGPTEATIGKTIHHVDFKRSYSVVPIGKPFSNTSIYILDEAQQLAPIGVHGELHIGGEGLAREYLNRPDLTAETFIKDPFSKNAGARLYKTGDLTRWLPDGNIEYLGRKDEQVKIRGHRIELGEIESVLLKSNLVHDAVVVVKEDKQGLKRLVGYVVAAGPINKEEMSLFLQARLPDYMVPVAWVQVENFPTTGNGKIDKKALPDPDFNSLLSKQFVEAGNKTEAEFIQIWQDLLGVEKIGVEDNFFELGGDSILTIQVVSRAKRLGYFLQPKDLFVHQTIRGLSKAIAERSAVTSMAEQGVLTGGSGLLPIQQWYLEKDNEHIDHFNQNVLLEIDQSITIEVLTNAIEQLVVHHDSLRFKYSKKEDQWNQEYTAIKGSLIVEDISSVYKDSLSNVITELAQRHQQSLDIKKGELIRMVLMQTPASDTSNRLFIVIHHLAIDGVSWRILLEDLELLLTESMTGNKADLGQKTSSYRQWYEAIENYGKTKRLFSEADHWINTRKSFQPLREDKNFPGKIRIKDMVTYSSTLPEEETLQLIQEVPRVYHTEINDILLATLGKVLCEWSHSSKVVVGLEGHGRNEISENIDLVRTVGWFTTHYPVLLTASGKNEGDWIKSVKEQLRQIPDKGLGYGILKYIKRNEALQGDEPWDIIFNYLGQFDNVIKGSKWFKAANESAGSGMSEEYIVDAKIAVNASVLSGTLALNWSYSRKHYHDETIKKLAEEYLAALRSFIAHCIGQQQTGKVVYTPSDYGLGAEISYKELDSFLKDEDEEEDNILIF